MDALVLGRLRPEGPLSQLSPRERDVLAAMAEGKSNNGIAKALVITEAAVEKHVTSIFQKLELDPGQTEHRRVLAVLAYLRDAPSATSASSPATRMDSAASAEGSARSASAQRASKAWL